MTRLQKVTFGEMGAGSFRYNVSIYLHRLPNADF